MRLETVSQYLDALAFILVTPEFLGDERVRKLQSRIRAALGKFYSDETENKAKEYGAAFGLFMYNLVFYVAIYLFSTRFEGTRYYQYIHSTPILFYSIYYFTICLLFTSSVALAISGAFLLLYLVQSPALRIFIFSIGAIVFFASRALMIWVSPNCP